MSDNQNNEIRIGDAEREDAVRRLGEHYEAGRLTADEHSERVDQALRARTNSDLTALFADLPGDRTGPRPTDATGNKSSRPRADWGPPWARSGWQPPRVGGMPVPLLALAGIAVLVGLACAIGGGHPPVFPLLVLAIVAAFVIRRRKRSA